VKKSLKVTLRQIVEQFVLPWRCITYVSILLGLAMLACFVFTWCGEQFAGEFVAKETAWLFAICQAKDPDEIDDFEHRTMKPTISFEHLEDSYRVEFYASRDRGVVGLTTIVSGQPTSSPLLSGSLWPNGGALMRRFPTATVRVKLGWNVKSTLIPVPADFSMSSRGPTKSQSGEP
jgi:hypothetical protein